MKRPVSMNTRQRLDEMAAWHDDDAQEDDLAPARGLSIAFLASMLFWATCAFGLAVAGVRVWQGL